MMYRDRRHAGRELAQQLMHYADRDDVIVLGLPRGGVPVAFEVARALRAPMDVFLVRKLGLPGNEEYAMGAIASGGVRVLVDDAVRHFHIDQRVIDAAAERESRELQRREQAYRGGRPLPALEGKVSIVVDDGLATGATMRAAITALRRLHPARIVVAVPVAAAEACGQLRAQVDELVCPQTPAGFAGVGQWYQDFSQTDDAEVRRLLDQIEAGRINPPQVSKRRAHAAEANSPAPPPDKHATG